MGLVGLNSVGYDVFHTVCEGYPFLHCSSIHSVCHEHSENNFPAEEVQMAQAPCPFPTNLCFEQLVKTFVTGDSLDPIEFAYRPNRSTDEVRLP